MATTDELVARLYIAYYDRAPDPVGLEYWIGRLNAGVSLTDIANSFAASPEAKATYPYFLAPNVLSPDDFLAQVYLNVFGRPIDTGVGSGLEYYGAKLAAGVSPGEVLLEIIQNAVTNTTPGNTDAAFLANKVEVGLDWAVTAANSASIRGISLYNPDGSLTDSANASAHGVIDGVNETPASVDEGKAETAAYFVPTFNLTRETDHFDGTAGNDKFEAPLAPAIDGLVGVQTLQGTDVLDGKGGHDVLNAELNGTGLAQNPTISNIEVYNFTSIADLFGTGQIDLSRASGFEEIWNKDSRSNLDVLNVGQATDIGLQNVLGNTEFYFEYDTDVVVEEQNLTADKVGSQGSGPVWFDLWTGNLEYLTTLNLDVSNGVYLVLDEDANWAENLNITGSGILKLAGADDFYTSADGGHGLVNLNSTGYTGDLDLDVSGSPILESVLTGEGNDRIVVNNLSVDGNLSVDLGGGENTLAINDHGFGPGGNTINHTEISNLDFTGGVTNVQTLEFVDNVRFTGPAAGPTLDLDGFDVAPATIKFADFDANGRGFTIANAGADLTLSAADDFEMAGGKLTVNGVVNLTVESTGGGFFSDVELNGSVSSTTLQTLTVNAADQADVNLTTPAELKVLKDVSVSAVDGDANLTIKGNAGTVQVNGVHQTQTITVNVTAGAALPPFFLTRAASGTFNLNSSSLYSGTLAAAYSETDLSLTPATSPVFDIGAASDLAGALNTAGLLWTGPQSGNGFTATASGNQVVVTWADFGVHEAIHYTNGTTTQGTINSVTADAPTTNVLPVAMIPGTGYEALETVVVSGGDDARANLTDVYGKFTLEVNAGVGATDDVGVGPSHDATVNLFNTEVTTVTVTAPDNASVNIGGNTIGARSLTSVDVTADHADIKIGTDNLDHGVGNNYSSLTTVTVDADTANIKLGATNVALDHNGDFGAFKTLDISSVITHVDVNTVDANFAPGVSQFVTYDIGATQDGDHTTVDVNFTTLFDNAREVFNFVGNDIGEVEINGFTWSADALATNGDRLDLSHFANIHSAGDLIFTNDGGNLVITDLGGDDFSGSITLVGLGTHATEVSAFNIIYA